MPRECKECGSEFESSHPRAEFCGTPCRMDFNNRRGARGAELYDLIMCMNYERDYARTNKFRSVVDRMASTFRQEDKEERNGRPSYIRGDELQARLQRYAKPQP
jgi:hypothetical protein